MEYVLITGASSGMGALCAKRLSKYNNLILASENIEMLGQVRNECDNKDNHILWHCNFATERDKIYDSLCNVLKDNDATVKSYVHFAGITQILPIKNFTIPYVDKIFNVNFFSIIEILRVLLKKVNRDSLNNIVLISALFSIRGDIGNSIYCSSKGAINSLVLSLARELAPKIRINSLLPGGIDTPMSAKSNPEHIEEMRKDTPLGLGNSDDVIDYVEFLLSNKAKWITGQNLLIDGGRSTK
jgi:NAD(P)-dependent dehydrogenase (short-subunit alcohol dehydrogenase family)